MKKIILIMLLMILNIFAGPKDYILVVGGTFFMGEPLDEKGYEVASTSRVTLDSFYISKYEVTQKEFEGIMGFNPSQFRGNGEDLPVENLTWYEAVMYANKLSEKEGIKPYYKISNIIEKKNRITDAKVTRVGGKGYRLPTEAEWEYAARGGNKSKGYKYSGSNDLQEVAWLGLNIKSSTQPVGGKKPNELGLYDMSGNVWEWCWDWSKYPLISGEKTNPIGPNSGERRVRRGGAWFSHKDFAYVYFRYDEQPYITDAFTGFRLVKPAKEEKIAVTADEELIKAINSNNLNNAINAINKGADVFRLTMDKEIQMGIYESTMSKDMWKYLFLKMNDINIIKKSDHYKKDEYLKMLEKGFNIIDEGLKDIVQENYSNNGIFKGREGYFELFEFLLKSGANPNVVFRELIESYLEYYVDKFDSNSEEDNQYVDIIRQKISLLLKYKADPNIEIYEGNTAIMLALKYDELNLSKILLEYGADINAENDQGETYLHIAVTEYESQKMESIKFALNNGADVNIKNWGNESAYTLAVKDENLDLVNLFNQYKPNLNDIEEDKNSTINGEYILVEGGTFVMGDTFGDDDENPIHSVTIDSFYMNKYEVTQKEFKELMGYNPSYFYGDNRPVEMVTWLQAIMYANKLSEKEGIAPYYNIDRVTRKDEDGEMITVSIAGVSILGGNGYRLPTEAEWEYAARGGNKSKGYKYSGSNNIDKVAEYKENNDESTKPVGGKKPNELGIYDMSGNVWEWCWDWYDSYTSSDKTNPTGPSSGTYHVLRGGSWGSDASRTTVTKRATSVYSNYDNLYGFRLVRGL